jgi:phage gp36-like protein
MSYCTQADLESRYGEREILQLTTPEIPDAWEVDATRLGRAIADADAEIDGYLTDGGYALPFSAVPYRLVRHACVLARWYLYDDSRPQGVEDEAKLTRGWLERVAEGKVKLIGPEPRSGGGVEFYAGRKVFPGGGY